VLKTIGRRVLIVIPMLWVIATLAFYLVNLIPGTPGRTILGESATEEQVAALNKELGYDRPLIAQYGSWLSDAVRGQFGNSLQTGRSAVSDIMERLPITLSIVIAATIISIAVGVTLGVLAATRGRRLDRAIQGASSLAMSLPSFWLGVLLVYAVALKLGLLPAVGYVPLAESPVDWVRSLILPAVSVAMIGTAAITRQTRGALLDQLNQDYVRTLFATGLSRRSVVLKHALRNASVPIATNVGFQFIGLLGSTVIVEQVFAINGLGQLTVQAVNSKDLPLLLTIVVLTTAIVIVVNLLVDVVTVWLNPKARRA
jgi:peptide/nickel transport system permease protein